MIFIYYNSKIIISVGSSIQEYNSVEELLDKLANNIILETLNYFISYWTGSVVKINTSSFQVKPSLVPRFC